jgi:hypothetical protein
VRFYQDAFFTGRAGRYVKVGCEEGHSSQGGLREGNLKGGFFTEDPAEFAKEGSGNGHLFP